MRDSIYQVHWDRYTVKMGETAQAWPGDEWGNEDSWQLIFDTLFVPYGVATWSNCVEVGGGSGKYTLKVLKASTTGRVIESDISPKYQELCRSRLTESGMVDRVKFVQLDLIPNTLLKAVQETGLVGKIDAFYSIDAMVHVDLQHLIIYLVTAAKVLRPEGKLIMTLANSTSDGGFNKLIRDAAQLFRRQDQPTAKFEWMSPDMVSDLLPRLGFAIDLIGTRGRDIHLVASKVVEPVATLECVLG